MKNKGEKAYIFRLSLSDLYDDTAEGERRTEAGKLNAFSFQEQPTAYVCCRC
jgi:hypothetical protein